LRDADLRERRLVADLRDLRLDEVERRLVADLRERLLVADFLDLLEVDLRLRLEAERRLEADFLDFLEVERRFDDLRRLFPTSTPG
jgi:hypothetical protein